MEPTQKIVLDYYAYRDIYNFAEEQYNNLKNDTRIIVQNGEKDRIVTDVTKKVQEFCKYIMNSNDIQSKDFIKKFVYTKNDNDPTAKKIVEISEKFLANNKKIDLSKIISDSCMNDNIKAFIVNESNLFLHNLTLCNANLPIHVKTYNSVLCNSIFSKDTKNSIENIKNDLAEKLPYEWDQYAKCLDAEIIKMIYQRIKLILNGGLQSPKIPGEAIIIDKSISEDVLKFDTNDDSAKKLLGFIAGQIPQVITDHFKEFDIDVKVTECTYSSLKAAVQVPKIGEKINDYLIGQIKDKNL